MHKCSSCAQGKMRRQVRRAPRESLALAAPGNRLAIDFHDFEQGYAGFSSAMMITCRATGYTWDFYLTERTSDALSPTLDDFLAMLLTQYGIKAKRIETDNELLRHPDITQSLSARGIIVEPSASNTQAQNGGAERIAGVIKTKARCMRIGANFPEALWPEITTCATYLYNRTPAASRGWKSPYELFHSRFRLGECSPLARPDLSHLRSYGCRAYAMTSDAQLGRQRKRKLAPRAWLGFLVGYTSSNSYRIWNPLRNEVFTTRDVIFDEHRHFDGSLPKLAEEIREMDLHDIQQRIDQLIKASENMRVTQDADEEGDDIEEHADASANAQRTSSDTSYTKARFEPMPTPPQSPPAAFFTAVGVGGGDEDEGSPFGEESPKERTTHRISWKAAFLAGIRPRKRLEDNPRRAHWPDHPVAATQGGHLGNFNRSTLAHKGDMPPLQQRRHAGEKKSREETRLQVRALGTLAERAARSAPESSPKEKKAGLIGTHWRNLCPLPSNGQLAQHPYRDEFKEAEKSHLQGHKVAGSWEKVPRALAAGHQILGCHWVYTYKLDKHGRLTKFKARLVIRGD
ncbi:Integrase catalytic domain-containing protein [Fusarium sp. Ph1]|nr:Integrase catalytic domain-containing protein [Fusarium sp. Ph1]